jgi:hypothetical protein
LGMAKYATALLDVGARFISPSPFPIFILS